MPKKLKETILPPAEFDTYEQFAARLGVSVRSVHRLVDGGLPVIRLPGMGRRIDPVAGRAYIRGELPPPAPVRRGRPPVRR